MKEISPPTPSDRLWQAIVRLENAVHAPEDAPEHSGEEVIGLAYPDAEGDTLVYELSYHKDEDGVYWPTTETEVNRDIATNLGLPGVRRGVDVHKEAITLSADTEVVIAVDNIRRLGDTATILAMTSRVETMLRKFQEKDNGTQWWIADTAEFWGNA